MYDKEDDYDILFKILIIGDSGVGKSNILLRFVKNEFLDDLRSTVGVEFGSKLMKIDNFQIKAQIWDTAGQERYRSITSAYYKGAKGVLIVYDITKKETFKNLDRWISDFKMRCDENASIIIVGNKIDLKESREVTKEEGLNKAKENNIAFYETSAKENENIQLVFTFLMEELVKNFKKNLDENFHINDNNKNKRKKSEDKNNMDIDNEKIVGAFNNENNAFDIDKGNQIISSKKCC